MPDKVTHHMAFESNCDENPSVLWRVVSMQTIFGKLQRHTMFVATEEEAGKLEDSIKEGGHKILSVRKYIFAHGSGYHEEAKQEGSG